jgi:long-chain acyl-CoA synthetase
MINSTMKMVRPKIEKAYKERIDYMYSSEGKQTLNPQNMEAVL